MYTTITTKKRHGKRAYNSPCIERIRLDNTISLTLDSDNDPDNDPDNWTKASEHFNNDPFRTSFG